MTMQCVAKWFIWLFRNSLPPGMHGQYPPLCITALFSGGLSIQCHSQSERCQNSVGHSEYPSSVLQAQSRSQQVLLTPPDIGKLDIIYYKTIHRAEFQCNCKYYFFCTKANKYLWSIEWRILNYWQGRKKIYIQTSCTASKYFCHNKEFINELLNERAIFSMRE